MVKKRKVIAKTTVMNSKILGQTLITTYEIPVDDIAKLLGIKGNVQEEPEIEKNKLIITFADQIVDGGGHTF